MLLSDPASRWCARPGGEPLHENAQSHAHARQCLAVERNWDHPCYHPCYLGQAACTRAHPSPQKPHPTPPTYLPIFLPAPLPGAHAAPRPRHQVPRVLQRQLPVGLRVMLLQQPQKHLLPLQVVCGKLLCHCLHLPGPRPLPPARRAATAGVRKQAPAGKWGARNVPQSPAPPAPARGAESMPLRLAGGEHAPACCRPPSPLQLRPLSCPAVHVAVPEVGVRVLRVQLRPAGVAQVRPTGTPHVVAAVNLLDGSLAGGAALAGGLQGRRHSMHRH